MWRNHPDVRDFAKALFGVGVMYVVLFSVLALCAAFGGAN